MASTDEEPSSAPAPDSGGSAAGQAMRAELARQGVSMEPLPSAPAATKALATPDARVAVRKKVSGRARVWFANGGQGPTGKMMDVSLTGACVLLDNMVTPKSICTLECDVFQEGKRFVFRCQAVSVYGVLASGQGFKIGFVFGPMDTATSETVKALVA